MAFAEAQAWCSKPRVEHTPTRSILVRLRRTHGTGFVVCSVPIIRDAELVPRPGTPEMLPEMS